MKQMLEPLRAVNSSTKAEKTRTREDRKPGQERQVLEAEHPVIRTHPETGRKALYVNIGHTLRFVGMTEEESAGLLAYLFEHQSRPEFTCRFSWQPGSIAFWDNRCALHNPINDYHGQAPDYAPGHAGRGPPAVKLLVLPGDGIGPEITAATVVALQAAGERFGLPLDLVHDVVGHASYQRHGTTVRPELLDRARQADGLILGPTASLDFRDEGKGEINPSKFFRKGLDLFANIRPSRTYDGLPGRVGVFDLVVVRENTEGFYADRNMEIGNGEILVTPEVAISLRRITRHCCLRIARAACDLAMRRGRRVTAVHKANVLKICDGMFLDACREVVAEYPGITLDTVIVDAMMAYVVRDPRRFDVIVTTNMFGDILSDLTAELSGSLGPRRLAECGG